MNDKCMQKIKIGHRAKFRDRDNLFPQVLFPFRAILRPIFTSGVLHALLPADLCLTGLQISTNQRATRKCIWRSIHSRAFREGKFTVLRNSGILFLTVQHLSTFAYDTHG